MSKPRTGRSQNFLKSEKAAVAIEYCLIAGLMALAIIAGLPSITGGVTKLFNDIATALPM